MKKIKKGGKRSMKKAMSVFIALVLVLSQLSLLSLAAGKTVTGISAVAKKQYIENYDGYLKPDYETDEEYFWYVIDSADFIYTVKFSDGSTVTGDWWQISDEVGYPEVYADQSAEAPWGVGKHTVTISLMGVKGTAEVEVVETPIESITAVCKKKYIENCGGYFGTDKWGEKYFRYDVFGDDFKITVKYKDGTVYEGDSEKIYYMTGEYLRLTTSQSAEAPWGVGKHTVSLSFMGAEGTAEVEVIANPIESIDILDVSPLKANVDGRWELDWNTEESYFSYNVPQFSYKLNFKDGTSETGLYNDTNWETWNMKVDAKQSASNTWGEGKENRVTVSAGNVSAEFSCKIVPGGSFEYAVQDGGAVITKSLVPTENLVIPAEIDGYPVIGIEELFENGYGLCANTAKSVVVPDSVKFLSDNWANGFTYVEEITIGKSVANLSYEMFLYYGYESIYDNLKAVRVSSENPNYKDIDGVVYTKDGATLVFYPVAKGSDYSVPANVKNIDILYKNSYRDINIIIDKNSSNFVTVDGVLYSADKTKVIRCNADKTGDYVMPESVTEIVENAFKGCSELENVEISDKVTDIVYASFAECTSLKSVKLPSGLKSIGKQAFSDCDSLESITIPDAVTAVNEGAFFSCDSLLTAKIGKGITEIPAGAFSYCVSLENVTVPSNVKTIGDEAFSGCSSLENAALGSVETIGNLAFKNTAIEKAVLPDTVTDIVYGAFMNNNNLAEIEMPDKLVRVGVNAFDGTEWLKNQADGAVYAGRMLYTYKGMMPKNTTVTVKEDTLGISEYAFAGENNLKSVLLPEGLLDIGGFAFKNVFFNEIAIPESVTNIGDFALGYYGGYKNYKNDDLTIYGYTGSEAERYAAENGFKFVALTKPVDEDTGISVLPDYADDTFAEVSLEVDKISESNVRAEYDITLTKDGTEIQPSGKVRVKIPVPAEMNGAAARVFRQENDGTFTNMNAVYADGYMVFTTDHFSRYILTTINPDGSDVLLGDVNGDGVVNSADSVLILRYDAGLVTLTDDQLKAADVNGDGVVNSADSVKVLRYDAGLISGF